MAVTDKSRFSRITEDIRAWTITRPPYYNSDENGQPTGPLQYGSGVLNEFVRRVDKPFQYLIGSRSTATTPGFGRGTYSLPLRALGSYNREEITGSEISSQTSYVNVTNPNNGPGSEGYRPSVLVTVNQIGYAYGEYKISSWDQEMENRAKRGLLAQVRNSSVNLAIATAERRKTAETVASAATRIAGAALQLRRGNFKKAASALGVIPKKRAGRRFNKDYAIDQGNAIGSAWLELQYGWKPLLNDVYGSAKALAEARVGTNSVFIRKAGFARKSEQETKVVNYPLGQFTTGSWFSMTSTDQSYFRKWGVVYSAASAPVTIAKELGFTNPLLVAWELVPFSFVADWFLPIGNYLESLDATAGLTLLDSYTSSKVTYNSTIGIYSQTSYINWQLNTSHGEGFRKIRRFNRIAQVGFPSVPLPSFKNPLSTSHVASAMALLLQTFKR